MAALQAERVRLDALAQKVAHRREALGQIGELKRRLVAIDERFASLPTPEAVAAIRVSLEARRAALEAATAEAEEKRTHWVRERQDVETKATQYLNQGLELKAQLETLEKVTEKIDKISVFGGLDAVLKDLVKIR